MTAFPPRARLQAVLAGLARHLPESHAVLVEAPELSDGRAALAALGDADMRDRVAAALTEGEAGWMADRIVRNWSRIGGVRIEPAACLVGPEDVWVPGLTATVSLSVAVTGLAPGWTVRWPDGAQVGADGVSAEIQVATPPGTTAAAHNASVRVIGRIADTTEAGGRREVLAARHTIALRRPIVSIGDGGRAIIVRDQAGLPAAGLRLVVGETEATLPEDGVLALEPPLGPGATVNIGGVPVPIEPGIGDDGHGPG